MIKQDRMLLIPEDDGECPTYDDTGQCNECFAWLCQSKPHYPMPAIQYKAHWSKTGKRGPKLILRERMSSGLWFAVRIWSSDTVPVFDTHSETANTY